jgi:hypothetical protein
MIVLCQGAYFELVIEHYKYSVQLEIMFTTRMRIAPLLLRQNPDSRINVLLPNRMS